MIKLSIILLTLFLNFQSELVHTAIQSDVESLLEQAEQYMDDLDEQAALDTYLQILEKDPSHYEALWNASLLHSTIGFRYDSDEQQKEYFERAEELAQKGVDAYPDKGHPYYVMAVAKGRMAEVVGTNRRIELAHKVEEYVKKALDLMPEHAPSWHLYGVWQSEIANVSRAERFAARFISAGLPDGSNENAEEYLKKAIDLEPESIIIRLDLAMHFKRAGESSKAVPVLEELLSLDLEPQTKDDPDHLERARSMLEDLS